VDFIGLAGALGSSWQLYGFNPRGLDATRLPHSSVEAAAKAYARELVEKLPYVDIHLLGHSFGGWVALELALLLGESGRRVASLTLVDSECPGRPARDVTRPEVLAYLGHLYELAAKRSLGITLEALEARAPDAQLAYLHAALVRGELISKRSDPATIRGAVSTFEAAIRAEYTPQASFNGAAQLLLVPRQGETEGDAALRMNGVWTGWQQFVPKLRLRHSAGDHIAILRAPHVQAIADSLNEVRVDTGRQAAEPHERWTRPDGMGTGRLSL
jgi:arthrofactin-type cyclic lipopeptide synthetase C